MKIFKFYIKCFLMTGLIFLYILVAFVIMIFSRSESQRKNLCRNCSYFTKIALRFLGIKVRKNMDFLNEEETYLIVSNHLSYMDVLVISSFFTTSFVTSTEIEKDIFLGMMAKLGGSIFVERRKKTRLLKDLGSVSEVLSGGLNVMFFPEGTSTDGEDVISFKKTLFRSAIMCGVKILPLCICYVAIDKKPITRENRDLVFWYGDMKFFPHFIKFLKLESVEVNLEVLPTILPLSMTPDTISKLARSSIQKAYKKVSHL